MAKPTITPSPYLTSSLNSRRVNREGVDGISLDPHSGGIGLAKALAAKEQGSNPNIRVDGGRGTRASEAESGKGNRELSVSSTSDSTAGETKGDIRQAIATPGDYDRRLKANRYASKWRKLNKAKQHFYTFRWMIKRLYNLTITQYYVLLLKQLFKCRICGYIHKDDKGRKGALCVDHDHATGKVRGLVCNNCNLLIGTIEAARNSGLLAKVLNYLEENKNEGCYPEPHIS